MKQSLNILVVGPHPDDQEIGMGGTIAALVDQGHNVLLLDMTDGSPTPTGDRASRLKEARRALRALAGKTKRRTIGTLTRYLLDLPNRTVEHTIEARHKVASVIRAHQSGVLFLPHPLDAHPDHIATTRIAEDARFDAKLTKIQLPVPGGFEAIGPPVYPKWVFYYYCSHLRRVPDPHFVFDTGATVHRKLRAIAAYKSQFGPSTHNAGFADRVAAQDAYFGTRIGTSAGEPFWCKEPLGLASLAGLVVP